MTPATPVAAIRQLAHNVARLAHQSVEERWLVQAEGALLEYAAIREAQETKWQPIETAPKGGGAEYTTDPNWVKPPHILLFWPRADIGIQIGYWDWYYAEGGIGFTNGQAWVCPDGPFTVWPTHWMPLPAPPKRRRGEHP